MDESVRLGAIIAEKYRIDRVIGRGAMGIVFAATHLQLQTVRAIKLMLPRALASPGAEACFFREAWAACAMESDHVARVLDVGEHNGLPFMVIEHLEGSDLGAVLERRKALPVREATLYALQTCDALAEAHALGIVHRDIKPANLFLTRRKDGTACVKVLDFGLAKLMSLPAGEDEDREPASSGMLVGSPCYMSPEQVWAQRDIDARSDVWALGVVLYQMLTSQLPFRAPCRVGVLSLMAAIAETTPTPPSELVPAIPAGLEAVILRCLEKDRERRFQSVAELAIALAPFAPVDGALLVARIRRMLGGAQANAGERCTSDYPAALPAAGAPRLTPIPAAATAQAAQGPGTLTGAAWGATPTLTRAGFESSVRRAARAGAPGLHRLRSDLAIGGLVALALFIGIALGANRDAVTSASSTWVGTPRSRVPQSTRAEVPAARAGVAAAAHGLARVREASRR